MYIKHNDDPRQKLKKILETIWQRGNEAQKLLAIGNYETAQEFLTKRWHAFLNLRAYYHKHKDSLHPWINEPGAGCELWQKITLQDAHLLRDLRQMKEKTQFKLAKSRDYLITIQHYKTSFKHNKFIKSA